MVGPREPLRSPAVVRVLVEENAPDVATIVHVPILQAYTAKSSNTLQQASGGFKQTINSASQSFLVCVGPPWQNQSIPRWLLAMALLL